MRFVDNDREGAILICCRNIVQDELELVHYGNDDLLTLIQKGMQIGRRLCPAYCRGNLRELLYRIFDLLIEVDTVGNHNNSIKDILTAVLKRDKLMGEPSY